MKKMFNYLLVGTMALGLFAAQSCTKTCDPGYSGSDCKTETRVQYYGNYKTSGTAVVTGGGSGPVTDLIITASSSTVGVQNFNLSYTLGGTTYALNGKFDTNGTSFTIPSQTAGGLTYSGSGSFTTSSLTLQLTEVDGTQTTTINLTGPKQ